MVLMVGHEGVYLVAFPGLRVNRRRVGYLGGGEFRPPCLKNRAQEGLQEEAYQRAAESNRDYRPDVGLAMLLQSLLR